MTPEAEPPEVPLSEAESRRAAADELMLDALATGASYADAAAASGQSARTVRRRVADPGFAAELARRRSERVSHLTGQLVGLGPRAVAVLAEVLEAEAVADRLRAANLILGSLRRFRADGDIDARLAALELAAGLTPATAVTPGEM